MLTSLTLHKIVMPSATASHATADASAALSALDTRMIPITFGVIGCILTLATIIVGVVQIRATRMKQRDTEMGPIAPIREQQQPEAPYHPDAPDHPDATNACASS